ncbi:MAG: hypothetical protein ABL907_03655, partial [Hyphomicrobium sp.]
GGPERAEVARAPFKEIRPVRKLKHNLEQDTGKDPRQSIFRQRSQRFAEENATTQRVKAISEFS